MPRNGRQYKIWFFSSLRLLAIVGCTLTVHMEDAWDRLKDAGKREEEGVAKRSSQGTLLWGDRAYEALMQKTDEEEMTTQPGRRCASSERQDTLENECHSATPDPHQHYTLPILVFSSSSQWTWAGLVLCLQKKSYHSADGEPTSKALDTLVQHGEWFVSFLPFLLDSFLFLTLHFIPIPLFSYLLFFFLANILNTCAGLYPRFTCEAR